MSPKFRNVTRNPTTEKDNFCGMNINICIKVGFISLHKGSGVPRNFFRGEFNKFS